MQSAIDKAVFEADQVKEMLKHPGMAIVRKKIASRIAQIRVRWFMASTPEQAERLRNEAKSLALFFSIANFVVAEGHMAKRRVLAQGSVTDEGEPPTELK